MLFMIHACVLRGRKLHEAVSCPSNAASDVHLTGLEEDDASNQDVDRASTQCQSALMPSRARFAIL